jgi:hypothetical protein
MRIAKILTLVCCLLSLNLFSQTKLIAHKSHSGSMETFKTSLKNNLFDMGEHNFGEAPRIRVKKAKLDSVIYVSDSLSVMVTSLYCQEKDVYDFNEKKEQKQEESLDYGELWSAGRDTVHNHPLFTKKHSLDSIREILEKDYYFNNPVSTVKFIGYDNSKSKPIANVQSNNTKANFKIKEKPSGSLPLPADKEIRKPFDIKIIIAVVIIGLFSLVAGALPGNFRK